MIEGGRNGIALTFGFTWGIGEEGKAIEEVRNGTKYVLKDSAMPVQKVERNSQCRSTNPNHSYSKI